MDKSQYTPLLAIWLAVLIPLLSICWGKRSAGLVAAYCFQMWLFYWTGALLHALPWSQLPEDDAVWLGFQQATYAIVAFAAGALILARPLARALWRKVPPGPDSSADSSLPRRYTLIGLIAYFILAPTVGRVPGMNAVVAVGCQLVVVGLCLQCWTSWRTQGRAAFLRSLAPSLLIPLVILLVQGFMSYGALTIAVILLFAAQFHRPRWVLAAVAVVLGYAGITVFVNYMRDRNDIRAAIWGGEELSGRIGQLWRTAASMEPFDASEPEQLERFDMRLNQCALVGAAVDNLARTGEFAHGRTILEAFMGIVPRLIWRDKPMFAGSGDLASRFTGREFATGTSVGVGPVLELYANFGAMGVVAGFLVLGAVIGALDRCAAAALRHANSGCFMLFFLLGLSWLNVSGSFVEVTAACAASTMVGSVLRCMTEHRPGTHIPGGSTA